MDGLRELIGEMHYLVPVALLAAGAVLVLRPGAAGGAPVPRRRACACSLAGCLGLAAGTLGLGRGGEGARGGAARSATACYGLPPR